MELRLKELLKEKGVTTYQLAEHFGVTQPTISSRMNGNPDIKWLFRVAEYLNVDISELFSTPAESQFSCPYCGGKIKVGKE